MTTMRFRGLTPMLRTPDLHGSIAFYVDRLGFTLHSHSETDGWASLRRDDIELMLATPNAHTGHAKPAFTGSLYFRLDDGPAIDALWSSVQGKVHTCYPPETFPYGMREFGIYDDNGYLLQFGAPAVPGHP
ncbi:bleomycin resistance family protein [Luteimonas aestuarii]|uniref:Bleomycin resistance family protein n=2 Tax=Luteimonas aestuarii TaxID=453837 RepID=A0A4R5TSU8_9GAMM|nr:bleomycin resistance family protein [Luteimonas aestuarii]